MVLSAQVIKVRTKKKGLQSRKVLGTKNAGTEPCKAIFEGGVFPYISRIHTAYI